MTKIPLYLAIFFFLLAGTASADGQGIPLSQRDTLFGDWGGLRPYLEDRGLTYEFVYTSEVFRNTSGGIMTGDDYRADLSLTLELNTEDAGWWRDGEFFVHLQAQHGDGISEDYVGDFQVLSNIDADDYAQVSEVWYRHYFLDRKLWLKFGKQEANSDFAFVDYGLEFLNSSPGFSPTIPLVTYPDQDWGLVLGIEPVDWFSMNIGVYQGSPDGGRAITNTLENLRGPMVMIEPAFHYSLKGRPGHLRLGAWWNGDNFDRLMRELPETPSFALNGLGLFRDAQTEGVLATFIGEFTGFLGEYVAAEVSRYLFGEPRGPREHRSYGFYATWDQEVWSENPEDKEDDQGVGVFGQYGWSDDRTIEAEQYVGAGLQWTGPIRHRNDDILGLGAFHVIFSEKLDVPERTETAIELFYRAQITPWFSLKPDLQYIAGPGGSNNPDAWVFGIRSEIVF